MNNPKFQQHGGASSAEHPPHGPYWKRMRHSKFFWVAFVFILIAMVVFVTSLNLAVVPADAPTPLTAPPQ